MIVYANFVHVHVDTFPITTYPELLGIHPPSAALGWDVHGTTTHRFLNGNLAVRMQFISHHVKC